MVKKRVVREKIVNVPNFFTLLRVVLTAVLLILYALGFSILTLLYVFIIAAITDLIDGFTARWLDQETLFGARFDILADRFLWVVFGLLLIFGYPNESYYNLQNFLMIFSREILAGLFLAFYLFILRKKTLLSYTRYSGKIMTTLQGVVIPSMIFSEKYSVFRFYEPLLVVCLFFGILCVFYYSIDLTFYKRIRDTKFGKYYDFVNPIAPAKYHEKH